MKYIVLLFLTGCVFKDRHPPEFKHDMTEAERYDCPHAPEKEQERCKVTSN